MKKVELRLNDEGKCCKYSFSCVGVLYWWLSTCSKKWLKDRVGRVLNRADISTTTVS